MTKCEIKVGDRVEVHAKRTFRRGKVDTVQQDWSTGQYALEFRDEDFGQCYWKQWADGGTVQVLQGKPEPIIGTNYAICTFQDNNWKWRASVYPEGYSTPLFQLARNFANRQDAHAEAERRFYTLMEASTL